MPKEVPDILARIVEHKRAELARILSARSAWEIQAEARTDHRDFRSALLAGSHTVIAEIKKASPSKGVLREDFQPRSIAQSYAAGGAGALSVLTDERFFQGKLSDLVEARSAVPIPVLRKDFTLEEVQVAQAAAHGADAVLLITALLPEIRLRQLREYAAQLGIHALVEVHDADELQLAVDSGADIIGVNNRDLRTFRVSLEVSLRLAEKIPARSVPVSESGIHSAEDVRTLRAAGFRAFLVGEHLIQSGNPSEALRALAA